MSSHPVPSFQLEQLPVERTSLKPTVRYDDNECSPLASTTRYISRPPTPGAVAGPSPPDTRLQDGLSPGILKFIIFILGLACVCSFGSITMLVGNEILANTHPNESTKTKTAAIVGSIGGIFAYGPPLLCYFFLEAIHTFLRKKGILVLLTILTTINFACAAVLGPIGCVIYLKLAKQKSDLAGLNIRNATLMSVIGGSFWMILVIGLSGYLSHTPRRSGEGESWRTTTRYREQCRDLDVAFAHR